MRRMSRIPQQARSAQFLASEERPAPAAGDKGFSKMTYIDRFEFYERAKKAYAIIATSETAQYANILLKKGLVLAK